MPRPPESAKPSTTAQAHTRRSCPASFRKRAHKLAEAAVAATAPPAAGGRHVAVGIAGYPRHAQSAVELREAAEAAAEHAATSPDGSAAAIAADGPRTVEYRPW